MKQPYVIRIKRVYLPASANDGLRILVDRLWPRGLTKEKAAVALWLKEIAPSTVLRTWFAHDPQKWKAFATRYRQELSANTPAVALLLKTIRQQPVCLLFASKDEEHNDAVVLKSFLEEKLREV